jgi:hypothetical protein
MHELKHETRFLLQPFQAILKQSSGNYVALHDRCFSLNFVNLITHGVTLNK